MTNRDKLNGMSNEELAEFIFNIIVSPCRMCSISYYNEELEMHMCTWDGLSCDKHIKEWLEQEVEE